MIEQLTDYLQQQDVSLQTTGASSDAPFLQTRYAKTVSKNIFSLLRSFSQFSASMHIFSNLLTSQTSIEEKRLFAKNAHYRPIPNCRPAKPTWNIPYDLVIVTESHEVYEFCKQHHLYCELITKASDVEHIRADVVRYIECDTFCYEVGQLANAHEVKNTQELLLEAQLCRLSSYRPLLEVFEQKELEALCSLLQPVNVQIPDIEQECVRLQEILDQTLHSQQFSARVLLDAVNLQKLPDQVVVAIDSVIQQSQLPTKLFSLTYPIRINEKEWALYERTIREQAFSGLVKQILLQKESIVKIPKLLKEYEHALLIQDAQNIICSYMKRQEGQYAQTTNAFLVEKSKNLLLDNPQPITYHFGKEHASIVLTGANSGGKTTLLEHIIQSVILHKMGFPVSGAKSIPDYEAIYYFAKSKGSTQKGAFETMLSQLSKVNPKNALILADELESVTEPSVASVIIAKTMDFFSKQGAHLVLASHLGNVFTSHASIRIDGIEAKGLDEQNKLIVDHNPVIGRLAKSTPELIIQRLAKEQAHPYFVHLSQALNS
ncbi:MAG: hypothetical protein ACMXYF_04620 [Candidatus Woesearchaeota archaeon]